MAYYPTPTPYSPPGYYTSAPSGGGGGGSGAGLGQFGFNVLNNALAATKPRPTSTNVGGAGSALNNLMQQLLASMGGGGSLPSEASLEQQARNTVNLQYNSQISALQRSLGLARSNAATSNQAIGKLYQGLAQSYEGDKKDTKKLFSDAQAQEKALLSDYTNTVKSNYQDSMNSLTESFKKLGIEQAAGASTTGALTKQEAQDLQRQTQESQGNKTVLSKQELADMRYWETGKGTAQMEGTQRQSDITAALNQLTNQTQGQIQDLIAQREIAYQSALSQLQAKVQEQAAAQSNQTWSRLMQLGNFEMAVGKYNQSMNQQSTQGFGKGLTGATNYLYQQFVNSQWGAGEGQRYDSILQGLVLQLPAGTTAEQAAKLAADEANRRGMSPSVMARAMLAYYGKA